MKKNLKTALTIQRGGCGLHNHRNFSVTVPARVPTASPVRRRAVAGRLNQFRYQKRPATDTEARGPGPGPPAVSSPNPSRAVCLPEPGPGRSRAGRGAPARQTDSESDLPEPAWRRHRAAVQPPGSLATAANGPGSGNPPRRPPPILKKKTCRVRRAPPARPGGRVMRVRRRGLRAARAARWRRGTGRVAPSSCRPIIYIYIYIYNAHT